MVVLALLALAAAGAACAPEPASGQDRSQPAGAAASTASPATGAPARPPVQGLGPAPEPSRPEPPGTGGDPAPATSAAPPPPAPTRRPAEPAGPPPPPPAPQPPSEPPDQDAPCPWYDGPGASQAEVRDALVAAAGQRFWPDDPITVPAPLMKAVAWQESGWQSTIIACDGGIGTMQIMPDTASWMNTRFGTSYDVDTLAGNTRIGAAYLEWLVKYFGDVWFAGSYDLDPAHCPEVDSPCLLNAVIASYNYGFGAVDQPDQIVIPNPQYVANVRALMTECSCLLI